MASRLPGLHRGLLRRRKYRRYPRHRGETGKIFPVAFRPVRDSLGIDNAADDGGSTGANDGATGHRPQGANDGATGRQRRRRINEAVMPATAPPRITHELIERVRSHDETARKDFGRQALDLAGAIARDLQPTAPLDVIDDLVQEGVLALVAYVSAGKGKADDPARLLSVSARNAMLRYLGRDEEQRAEAEAVFAAERPEPAGTHDAVLSAALNDALVRVPVREADVLRRYYGLGVRRQTGVEIAAEIGVTRQRIERIRNRALERLRDVPELRDEYAALVRGVGA